MSHCIGQTASSVPCSFYFKPQEYLPLVSSHHSRQTGQNKAFHLIYFLVGLPLTCRFQEKARDSPDRQPPPREFGRQGRGFLKFSYNSWDLSETLEFAGNYYPGIIRLEQGKKHLKQYREMVISGPRSAVLARINFEGLNISPFGHLRFEPM